MLSLPLGVAGSVYHEHVRRNRSAIPSSRNGEATTFQSFTFPQALQNCNCSIKLNEPDIVD
ncbi:hypothetical protein DPMN_044791 [Dreissena polymorpha]|uniref:Uncharacterized protein n=1 Tax=Dreissena polymorpha TaxID=45954 RepID=A0A9D4D323_DREPO|nr:hypothetical protein DPMN_044791 [Dreissena polymorpha]